MPNRFRGLTLKHLSAAVRLFNSVECKNFQECSGHCEEMSKPFSVNFGRFFSQLFFFFNLAKK